MRTQQNTGIFCHCGGQIIWITDQTEKDPPKFHMCDTIGGNPFGNPRPVEMETNHTCLCGKCGSLFDTEFIAKQMEDKKNRSQQKEIWDNNETNQDPASMGPDGEEHESPTASLEPE